MLLPQFTIGTVDLVAAFLLLYGLHRMSSPVTAPSGIFVAGIGMAVVILVSFLDIFGVSAVAKPFLPVNIGLAVIAVVLGGGVAWWAGKKVAMTAMPQMVAIYNGMGGGAAGAIAAVELFGRHTTGVTPLVVTLLGALIGAVSFSGSMIAWAKLQSILNNPLRFPGQKIVNAAAFVVTLYSAGTLFFWIVQAPYRLVLSIIPYRDKIYKFLVVNHALFVKNQRIHRIRRNNRTPIILKIGRISKNNHVNLSFFR